MHLVTLYGNMLTGHFQAVDKDSLIQEIGRQTTERIAEHRAHTETFTKLSPEEKKRATAERIESLRKEEKALVRLLEQHTDWRPGAHALLVATRSEAFSREEAVYLFID